MLCVFGVRKTDFCELHKLNSWRLGRVYVRVWRSCLLNLERFGVSIHCTSQESKGICAILVWSNWRGEQSRWHREITPSHLWLGQRNLKCKSRNSKSVLPKVRCVHSNPILGDTGVDRGHGACARLVVYSPAQNGLHLSQGCYWAIKRKLPLVLTL